MGVEMQEPSTVIQTFQNYWAISWYLGKKQHANSQVLLILKMFFPEVSVVVLSAPKYKITNVGKDGLDKRLTCVENIIRTVNVLNLK